MKAIPIDSLDACEPYVMRAGQHAAVQGAVAVKVYGGMGV